MEKISRDLERGTEQSLQNEMRIVFYVARTENQGLSNIPSKILKELVLTLIKSSTVADNGI